MTVLVKIFRLVKGEVSWNVLKLKASYSVNKPVTASFIGFLIIQIRRAVYSHCSEIRSQSFSWTNPDTRSYTDCQ